MRMFTQHQSSSFVPIFPRPSNDGTEEVMEDSERQRVTKLADGMKKNQSESQER